MGQPFELDRGPSDLLKIARRLAREYQNISPRHVIRVDSPLSGLLGDWDEARMERVVSNLISNGVKYSPQGGDVDHQCRTARNATGSCSPRCR